MDNETLEMLYTNHKEDLLEKLKTMATSANSGDFLARLANPEGFPPIPPLLFSSHLTRTLSSLFSLLMSHLCSLVSPLHSLLRSPRRSLLSLSLALFLASAPSFLPLSLSPSYNFAVKYMGALMEILVRDDNLFKVWQTILLQEGGDTWYGFGFIPKLIDPYLLDEKR
jgi:hypothetical protein